MILSGSFFVIRLCSRRPSPVKNSYYSRWSIEECLIWIKLSIPFAVFGRYSYATKTWFAWKYTRPSEDDQSTTYNTRRTVITTCWNETIWKNKWILFTAETKVRNPFNVPRSVYAMEIENVLGTTGSRRSFSIKSHGSETSDGFRGGLVVVFFSKKPLKRCLWFVIKICFDGLFLKIQLQFEK